MALTGQFLKSFPAAGPKQLHVDKRYVGDQVAAVLLTPTAGRQLVITDLLFSLSLAGTVCVFADADAEGNRLVDLDVGDVSGVDRIFFNRPIVLGPDAVLKVTTTGGGNLKIAVNGWEE